MIMNEGEHKISKHLAALIKSIFGYSMSDWISISYDCNDRYIAICNFAYKQLTFSQREGSTADDAIIKVLKKARRHAHNSGLVFRRCGLDGLIILDDVNRDDSRLTVTISLGRKR